MTAGVPDDRRFVTDGGLETDLIHHHGVDLPHFAAFPLVERAEGRALLARYYDDYAAIARSAGVGLMLESATWRASPDWGERLGWSPRALATANRVAVELLLRLREGYVEQGVDDILVSGSVGPRGDGYRAGEEVDPDDAERYHRPQLEAFAAAGADLATAYTLTGAGEAVGIVRAARSAGLPVAISFTVETDGRLPDGTTLADAVRRVDAEAPPEWFLVNCAHPLHIAEGLDEPGPWRERIRGIRANASRRSHAELDEAPSLDEGDPDELAAAHHALADDLPAVSIAGGCCGTDARHVAALWGVRA